MNTISLSNAEEIVTQLKDFLINRFNLKVSNNCDLNDRRKCADQQAAEVSSSFFITICSTVTFTIFFK